MADSAIVLGNEDTGKFLRTYSPADYQGAWFDADTLKDIKWFSNYVLDDRNGPDLRTFEIPGCSGSAPVGDVLICMNRISWEMIDDRVSGKYPAFTCIFDKSDETRGPDIYNVRGEARNNATACKFNKDPLPMIRDYVLKLDKYSSKTGFELSPEGKSFLGDKLTTYDIVKSNIIAREAMFKKYEKNKNGERADYVKSGLNFDDYKFSYDTDNNTDDFDF